MIKDIRKLDFMMPQHTSIFKLRLIVFGAYFVLAMGRIDAQPANETFQPLSFSLKQAVQSMDWAGGKLTLLVQEEQFAENIFAQGEKQQIFAGGLMKFYTAGAAQDILGSEFKFETRLELGSRPIRGEGDAFREESFLVVGGTGDPTLSGTEAGDYRDTWETFDRWAKLLSDRKIRRIDGPIVALAHRFDDRWQGLGWPDIPMGRTELPSVAALNFNRNCLDVFYKQGKKLREPAEYTIFPELQGYLYFTNRVTVFPPPVSAIKLERVADGNMVVAYGQIPPRETAHLRVAIEDPARFFAESLKARLIEKRIMVNGDAVSVYDPAMAGIPLDNLQLIDTVYSPPLGEILKSMIYGDHTLEAEVVLKTLGLHGPHAQQSGSAAAGSRAVMEWIASKRLSANGIIMVDGSGRSVINRTTAESLLALIRRITREDTDRAYRNLFPVIGEGALVGRMPGVIARTQVQGLASHSLPDEEPAWESFAGWIERPGKSNLLFCMVVNGSTMEPALVRNQMDQLILIMTE